jgi:lysozyme
MIQLPTTTFECAHGVDVSKWQGTIDWHRVAEESYPRITFAYVRSHYGKSLDPFAERNVNGAKEAGLHVGVYQYLKANEPREAQVEAFFIKHEKLLALCDLPPVLDVERDALWLAGPGTISQLIPQHRVEHVAAMVYGWNTDAIVLGFDPTIYTNLESGTILAKSPWWEAMRLRPLWVADYSVSPPRLPPPWAEHAIHQWTATGTVPGIHGPVCMDLAVKVRQ